MTPHITRHAIQRYQERVANLPDEQVRVVLSCPAVKTAIAFGAHVVRLGTGERVILEGANVVTVLPRRHFTRQVLRFGFGRYGKSERGLV